MHLGTLCRWTDTQGWHVCLKRSEWGQKSYLSIWGLGSYLEAQWPVRLRAATSLCCTLCHSIGLSFLCVLFNILLLLIIWEFTIIYFGHIHSPPHTSPNSSQVHPTSLYPLNFVFFLKNNPLSSIYATHILIDRMGVNPFIGVWLTC